MIQPGNDREMSRANTRVCYITCYSALAEPAFLDIVCPNGLLERLAKREAIDGRHAGRIATLRPQGFYMRAFGPELGISLRSVQRLSVY